VHSVISVPLQPSGGSSVDEYECVQNEIYYEIIYYIVFLRLCNLPTFKLNDRYAETGVKIVGGPWHTRPTQQRPPPM